MEGLLVHSGLPKCLSDRRQSGSQSSIPCGEEVAPWYGEGENDYPDCKEGCHLGRDAREALIHKRLDKRSNEPRPLVPELQQEDRRHEDWLEDAYEGEQRDSQPQRSHKPERVRLRMAHPTFNQSSSSATGLGTQGLQSPMVSVAAPGFNRHRAVFFFFAIQAAFCSTSCNFADCES